MYAIRKIDTENVLSLTLRGIVTEDQGIRAVQELNSTVRRMSKGFRLMMDVRRFKPASDEKANQLIKNALRAMILKRPSLVLRMGSRDIFHIIDQAYLELNLPFDFYLVSSENEEGAMAQLLKIEDPGLRDFGTWLQTHMKEFETPATNPFPRLPETCIDIRRFQVSEPPMQHMPVTFTVDTAGIGRIQEMYYRFGFCCDADGGQYMSAYWAPMTESAFSRQKSCTFVFDQPGRYMVRACVSSHPDVWDGPETAETMMTVFVRPNENADDFTGTCACESAFPFLPDMEVELVLNREHMTASVCPSRVYECDPRSQAMVIGQVSPPILSISHFDTVDVVRPHKGESDTVFRHGVQVLSLQTITHYPVSDGTTRDCLLIRFALPVGPVGLRRDRQTYRCPCQPHAENLKSRIMIRSRVLADDKDYYLSDLSVSGAGMVLPSKTAAHAEVVELFALGKKGALELVLQDLQNLQGQARQIPVSFEIVRIQERTHAQEIHIGLRFTEIDMEDETALSRFINTLQIIERQRQAEEEK